jgi:CHAT domain-containing protein
VPREEDKRLPGLPVFRPLNGTASEVNDLRPQFEDAFPGAPAPLRLVRQKATKAAVAAALPNYRYAHLATHGFFAQPTEPAPADVRGVLFTGSPRFRAAVGARHPGLLSGLVFAGVNSAGRKAEDTVLTALEAGELGLGGVQLVTLSACETGLGRLSGTDGVLGLQRALQVAGARSVAPSLWKVPDNATRALMREFYKQLWDKDPLGKAEALRRAQLRMIENQLWMIEKWDRDRGGTERVEEKGPLPPFFWAAFSLSGDWR